MRTSSAVPVTEEENDSSSFISITHVTQYYMSRAVIINCLVVYYKRGCEQDVALATKSIFNCITILDLVFKFQDSFLTLQLLLMGEDS